ncbi:hypothetical protein BsWGS_04803 [Bradybaena similaris]
MASQPCVAEGREGYEPSPAMRNTVANLSETNEDHLLVQLLVEIQEIKESARNFYNDTQGWVSNQNLRDIAVLKDFLKSTLNIPLTNRGGLSQQENSRLQVLLQFINYAFFMKKLDNDSALGNSKAEALRLLRFKILQASCTLRRLLPQVSAADLALYAEQDLSGHFFIMTDQKPPMKRAVCNLAVNQALNTFTHTEVLINARKVFISQDV